MQWAVQGVHAQLRYGSTPQAAVNYVRVALNLSPLQARVLLRKFVP